MPLHELTRQDVAGVPPRGCLRHRRPSKGLSMPCLMPLAWPTLMNMLEAFSSLLTTLVTK
eukprot:227813-Chlamydomonas_euryale.AAC.1